MAIIIAGLLIAGAIFIRPKEINKSVQVLDTSSITGTQTIVTKQADTKQKNTIDEDDDPILGSPHKS